jgi:hypothetical protein
VRWVEGKGICRISAYDERAKPIPRSVTVYSLEMSETQLRSLERLRHNKAPESPGSPGASTGTKAPSNGARGEHYKPKTHASGREAA